MKINFKPVKYIERELYDEDDNELIYRAVLVDESFDHCLGTEYAYSFGVSEDDDITLNGNIYEPGTGHWALINDDLNSLTTADFRPDDYI